MRGTPAGVELSASDLSNFLGCRHRTALDLAVVYGIRTVPHWLDPTLAVLQARGLDHERRYIDKLRAEGLDVEDLSEHSLDQVVALSAEAMRAGVEVIVQPALRDGRWFGRP